MQGVKMADALTGATIKITLERAVALASDQIGMVYGFKKDLETFKESVDMILAFLADAEEKQPNQQAVRLWLKRLQGVACDANNVLNELSYHRLRRSGEIGNQGKVCFFFPFTSVYFRWRMAREIKEINLKLETINKEAKSFGLNTRMEGGPNPTPPSAKTMQTDSILGQNVVGRANDASCIIQTLLSSTSNKVLVFPIVGMGGLGKTTLAKLIYNDQQISEHFDKRIWVSVPENFEATHLLKLILDSLASRKVKVETRDAIVQGIRNKLDEVKRYLLVLDDVWNGSHVLWDDFFLSLVGVSSTEGNCCIVTTRQLKVASIVSLNPPYLLQKLSDNDCWSILKEKALDGKEVPKELEAIRQDITRRCLGLPLAASVIGGLLRIKKKEDWLYIVDHGLLNLRKENTIMQILKLSFDHLPSPSIKKCFLYCSLFGKDFDIEREQLIQLWMAEGFLQPDLKNEMVMEEIGITYFNVLLQSSLLQEVREWKDLYGRMHGLVHDLVLSILRSEIYDDFGSSLGDSRFEVHHLLLNSSGAKPEKNLKDISRSLGALFLESAISDDLLTEFKYLRVLNLSWACLAELPSSIGKLILLRYLDLSGSTFKTLPESICKLYHLQTLRVIACPYLASLPRGMSNLISLRHLHIDHSEKLPMPLHMGRLSCLQTLEFFNIGETEGSRIEELGCLKDLKGRLHIRNLNLVNSVEEAKQANLFEKIKVVELVFAWGTYYFSDPKNVLEGLQPQPNLQALVIDRYMGHQLPAWFMNLSSSLKKLVRLSLNCPNCKEIPAFGELQFLKELQLVGLKNISCIEHSFYSSDNSIGGCGQVQPRTLFPALKSLEICYMENLMEWKEVEASLETGEAVDVFPMLERLAIKDCRQLMTTPGHFPSLKELEIRNVDRVLPIKQILSMVTTLSTLSIEAVVELSCISDVLAVQNNQNLKHLTLKKCSNLRHVQCAGISVLKLYIQNCENLTESPEDLLTCQSLKDLSIEECPNLGTILMSNAQQPLSSLQFLRISHSKGLHSLPSNLLESCTSLRRLEICSCANLNILPVDFQQAPSISMLNLSKCPNLTTMPKGFGFLTNLRELTIGPFSQSSQVDWSAVSLLPVHQLRLFGLPQTDFIPDQLQYLTGLTELHIHDFGIQALPEWFGKLRSLEQLCLENCTRLLYFPSLSAMRSLTQLRFVKISNCSKLGGRCRRWSGPNSEWNKISHIPDFIIR